MNKKILLNEEKLKETEEKTKKIAKTILITGLSIALILISTGINKHLEIKDKYSNKNKESIIEKLEHSKTVLEGILEKEEQKMLDNKKELNSKIETIKEEIKRLDRISFTGFNAAYYEREDKIDELKESIKKEEKDVDVIEDVLDESFDDCSFSTAKNNEYTSYYCKIKTAISIKENEIHNIDDVFSEYNIRKESHACTPFYIIGIFITFVSVMTSGMTYMTAKGREAFALATSQIIQTQNNKK